MQKQKQKTIDDFPEHAQTSKRIHALQIENVKVTEEKDQIITELLRPIPDEPRDRLITAGYGRDSVNSYGGASVLVLTGRGLRRLSRGK